MNKIIIITDIIVIITLKITNIIIYKTLANNWLLAITQILIIIIRIIYRLNIIIIIIMTGGNDRRPRR